MNIFKKSKEQVEENKSEDLKIENQENKRETTSEKKGVVSLQFSEKMSDKRIHSIITVAVRHCLSLSRLRILPARMAHPGS